MKTKAVVSDTDDVVDVRSLLGKIDFSPDNVVDAAAANPVLFVKSIQYRLQCLERKTRAEMNYKRIQAERELDIRKKAKARDEKLTEAHISSLLILDTAVSTATNDNEQAKVYDEYSKLVVEAFRMRRDSLRICSDMARSEMHSGDSDGILAVREKLKNKFPG